jgi:hypothetical protein
MCQKCEMHKDFLFLLILGVQTSIYIEDSTTNKHAALISIPQRSCPLRNTKY